MDGIAFATKVREPAAPDRPHSLPYNAALDGLRGLAVAGVIGTHFGLPLFDHGGNGVDLFFVLSGFLITSVLLDPVPAQPLSEFYWNRVTRLAPALIFVCAIYALAGYFYADIRQTAADIFAVVTYVANWTRAYDLGTPQYLAQAWSLSLEEQFYIVYPPVLAFLSRRLPRRWLAIVLSGLCLLVILDRAMVAASGGGPDRVYNGLDTHSDGLALGGALAAAMPGHRSNRVTAVIARCDLVALLAIPVLFAAVSWPQAVILTNLAAAWLIFGAAHPDKSSANAILAAAPLVWLGRLSYSLYLWHYPVQQLLSNQGLLSWQATLLIGVPVSIALAAVSYYLVERPILRSRRALSAPVRQRLGALSVSLVASAMLGGLAFFFGPLIVQSLEAPAFAITSYDPHASVVGEGFNRQPGGLSVVWVNTTARPPRSLSASWAGRKLAIYSQARRVAVFVPREFVDTVGRKTIEIGTADRTIPLDIDIAAHE